MLAAGCWVLAAGCWVLDGWESSVIYASGAHSAASLIADTCG